MSFIPLPPRSPSRSKFEEQVMLTDTFTIKNIKHHRSVLHFKISHETIPSVKLTVVPVQGSLEPGIR
jgi:hypothetical protein